MYCVKISTDEVLDGNGLFVSDHLAAQQFGTASAAARAIRSCNDSRADGAFICPISFSTVATIGDLI